MPPSIHKVLVHGDDIIRSSFLPICRYFEKAQEASNKIFRDSRAHKSRWSSRQNNNEDILGCSLVL